MNEPKKTLPTGKTLLQGRTYVPAAQTDIRQTFARLKKQPNVRLLKAR